MARYSVKHAVRVMLVSGSIASSMFAMDGGVMIQRSPQESPQSQDDSGAASPHLPATSRIAMRRGSTMGLGVDSQNLRRRLADLSVKSSEGSSPTASQSAVYYTERDRSLSAPVGPILSRLVTPRSSTHRSDSPRCATPQGILLSSIGHAVHEVPMKKRELLPDGSEVERVRIFPVNQFSSSNMAGELDEYATIHLCVNPKNKTCTVLKIEMHDDYVAAALPSDKQEAFKQDLIKRALELAAAKQKDLE